MKKHLKVLIIQSDLYIKTGGGELVYRKIIEKTPEIQFFYFIENEAENHPRPPNVQTLMLAPSRRLQLKDRLSLGKDFLPLLEKADRYAESARSMAFDLVDCPDYEICGYFLPRALEKYGVKTEGSVAALHGALSVSISHSWGNSFGGNPYLKEIETSFLKNVDGIYGISKKYIQQVEKKTKREAFLVDAMHFVEFRQDQWEDKKEKQKPTLICVGRTEKRKGNDLFVELVRWLDPTNYERAIHIGPEVRNYDGFTSSHFLDAAAWARGIRIAREESKPLGELLGIYQKNSMLVLPVRYDSFNLTALEALFSGCPVVISKQAGVCDYLDEKFPDLPYQKIDLDNLYSAIEDMKKILDNYSNYRSKLRDSLRKMGNVTPPPIKMANFYQEILENKKAERKAASENKYDYLVKENTKKLFKLNSLNFGNWAPIKKEKKLLRRASLILKNLFYFFAFCGDKQAGHEALNIIFKHRLFFSCLLIPEGNGKLLNEKKAHLLSLEESKIFRCDLWRVLARVEKALGNDSLAAVYGLRVLRHLGDDRFGLLPEVVSSLENAGYLREAEAARAMYGDLSRAEENTHNYLVNAFHANRSHVKKPFEILRDLRSPKNPKVSVIVSLYNASEKLKFFLTALKQQSLIQAGAVEIILVDSGSPGREAIVLEEFVRTQPMNVVYARSAQRETIQAAWNRGIGLARAPYLVFLGVDETLYPETLEYLATELDRSPDVDWVMGNSLVTRVGPNGLLQEDVMKYDRAGAGKDHAYLETCYLSWVGGMYRKNIHDRFGYYDESFGAAGDTEFKNRILPHIRVQFIDRTLGLFLNYPEGNTTASPRAEIEDLRAWYIHRTLAGVRYAFADRPTFEAENLLSLSLGYRKSYCSHLSSDIDYAKALAEYLCRHGSPLATTLKADLLWMQKTLCSFETNGMNLARLPPFINFLKSFHGFRKKEKNHRQLLRGKASPTYKIFNDNRYEQHSWLWN